MESLLLRVSEGEGRLFSEHFLLVMCEPDDGSREEGSFSGFSECEWRPMTTDCGAEVGVSCHARKACLFFVMVHA